MDELIEGVDYINHDDEEDIQTTFNEDTLDEMNENVIIDEVEENED